MENNNKQKQETFENLKNFFLSDMKMKETLLNLAPTELDDYSEETRIEYTDKLYKALKDFEIEFIEIANRFGNNPVGNNPGVIESIKSYFDKVKEKFLISNYEPGVIQKLYKEHFSDMNPKLIEDVKEEFVSDYFLGWDLEKIIKETKTVNELLHTYHSYVENNADLMESLPVISKKQNIFEWPITLYGEENEISNKLFEDFPVELDCGYTNIVSMQNKILMMVRDKGHALTIDIDTTNKDDILVKYFVPKLCNREMIEALPGINEKSITENGAIGMFQTSSEDMSKLLFDFIEKVPTDADIPEPSYYNVFQTEEVQENMTEIKEVTTDIEEPSNEDIENWTEDFKECAMISSSTPIFKRIKNSILQLFKREKNRRDRAQTELSSKKKKENELG